MAQSQNCPRSFYFTVVLYPLENDDHAMIFEYIKNHYEHAFIEHPHEYDTDPKTHTHVVFRLQKQSTVNGVNRFFGFDFCEIVENLQSMMQYLIHDTPSCIREFNNGNFEKRPFSVDKLVAPSKWRSLIEQKSHFVQLTQIMDDVSNGLTVWESIKSADAVDRECLAQYVIDHSSIVHLANQQLTALYRRGNKEIKNENISDLSWSEKN